MTQTRSCPAPQPHPEISAQNACGPKNPQSALLEQEPQVELIRSPAHRVFPSTETWQRQLGLELQPPAAAGQEVSPARHVWGPGRHFRRVQRPEQQSWLSSHRRPMALQAPAASWAAAGPNPLSSTPSTPPASAVVARRRVQPPAASERVNASKRRSYIVSPPLPWRAPRGRTRGRGYPSDPLSATSLEHDGHAVRAHG